MAKGQIKPQDDTWLDTTHNIPYFASNFEVDTTFAGADANGDVLSGTPYPANDGTIVGFVRNDFNVNGNFKSQAIVQVGLVNPNRLPVTLDAAAVTKLKADKNIYLKNATGNLDI